MLLFVISVYEYFFFHSIFILLTYIMKKNN